MNRAYLAGVLSGFAGGVMGAWLLPYLSDSKSHGIMAAAAAAQPQEVLSARRIQLVDNTGRTRAELAMSPDGGPGAAALPSDSSSTRRLTRSFPGSTRSIAR